MNTINKIKVSNMESPRGGTVANQFEIITDDGRYFQSYSSMIAFIPAYKECINPNAGTDNEYCPCPAHNGKITLDSHYWDYSMTTGKYRNMFLNEDKKETLNKINSGEYILANLN